MDTLAQLQQQHAKLLSCLERNLILDSQFMQLQSIRDPADPGFLKNLADNFCQDFEKRMRDLTTEVEKEEEVNHHPRIDDIVFNIKESSKCIGARQVVFVCQVFKLCYDSRRGGLMCLKVLEDVYLVLKENVEKILQLEQQILAAGGTVPIIKLAM